MNQTQYDGPLFLSGETVAIVGNGPSAIARPRDIDEYGCVVRVNLYPQTGYADRIGTRTDVWAICSNPVVRPHAPPEITRGMLLCSRPGSSRHEAQRDWMTRECERRGIVAAVLGQGLIDSALRVYHTVTPRGCPTTGCLTLGRAVLTVGADIWYTGLDANEGGYYWDRPHTGRVWDWWHNPEAERAVLAHYRAMGAKEMP